MEAGESPTPSYRNCYPQSQGTASFGSGVLLGLANQTFPLLFVPSLRSQIKKIVEEIQGKFIAAFSLSGLIVQQKRGFCFIRGSNCILLLPPGATHLFDRKTIQPSTGRYATSVKAVNYGLITNTFTRTVNL